MTWPLTWITEEKLTAICRELLKGARDPSRQKLNHKNIVDPFSALFDMAVNRMTYPEWINAEIRRQNQKSLQNAIGMFHQRVLGAIEGWEDLNVGELLDISNSERKIGAEIKNKFNTVKQSDLINLQKEMVNWWTAGHRDWTLYYVPILAKGRFDEPFTPSDRMTQNKAAVTEKVRTMDGVSFYALVTGEKNAMEKLYLVLPRVLNNLYPDFSLDCVKDPAYGYLYNKAVYYKK
jgi:hypothetical protein